MVANLPKTELHKTRRKDNQLPIEKSREINVIYGTKSDKDLNKLPVTPKRAALSELQPEMQTLIKSLLGENTKAPILLATENFALLHINPDNRVISLNDKKVMYFARQKLAQQNPHQDSKDATPLNREVTITAKEFKELCGLQDAKRAKQILKQACTFLRGFIWVKKGMNESFSSVTPYPEATYIEDPTGAKVTIEFSTTYAKSLCSEQVYFLPKLFYTINTKTNPYSIPLLDYIYSIAYGLNNFSKATLSVQTTLENTGFDIKTAKKNGKLNQLLKTPFERDMDALSDVLTWHYLDKDGKKLTDAELQRQWTVNEFLNLRVAINLHEEATPKAKRKKKVAASSPQPAKPNKKKTTTEFL